MVTDPIWLTESDVVDLVSLTEAIEAVEDALKSEAGGGTASMDKTHLLWGEGHSLQAVGAVDIVNGLVATKTWAHTGGGAAPLIMIWHADTGALAAVLEAFALGQLRTGAMSGVATRYLAEEGARHLAVIGSGRQALAQAAAVVRVRTIDLVTVYSPTPAHREQFVHQIATLSPSREVRVAGSVEEAVAGAQVITTVTRAREAFLTSDMLTARTHINAVGAITPERRELDVDLVRNAELVVADSPDVARRLAAELSDVDDIASLCDVVAGGPRRPGSGPTIFKAMGVGLADLAVAGLVLERALDQRRGTSLPARQRAEPQLKET